MTKNSKKAGRLACLFITAIIWGFAFVAQSQGNVMGPFTFNALRNCLGALSLLPVLRIFYGDLRPDAATLKGGICCGLCLFLASNVQQTALLYTSPGKTGFITACYMILVPVVGIFMGRRIGIKVAIAIVASAIGLYFLCIPAGEGLSNINIGDMLALLCALFYTAHILCIDHFAPKVQGIKMSFIQFIVCAALTAVPALLFEEAGISEIRSGLLPLLYAGILSSGVAYSLQITGQQSTDPTVASLILSLESCFSVLAGWMLLGDSLSLRELFGCCSMFFGIVLSQLPERKRQESLREEAAE